MSIVRERIPITPGLVDDDKRERVRQAGELNHQLDELFNWVSLLSSAVGTTGDGLIIGDYLLVLNETPAGPKNGSNRAYTLTKPPISDKHIILAKNGVIQFTAHNFVLSGSNLIYNNTVSDRPQSYDDHRCWFISNA